MINWEAKITVDQQLEEKQKELRQLRDSALAATDWLVARHRDEVESGWTTSLNAKQYTELMNYRQQLRDYTTHNNWVHLGLPSTPSFV